MGGVMARQQVPLPRGVRALLGFVCALVLVDTIFFTALTPLLPHYVHVAGLSKAQAGYLVAAYPLGTLIGAAVIGALFGPVVGTIADQVGTGPAFAGAGVAGAALIVAAFLVP